MTTSNINTSKLKRKTILGFAVIIVIYELLLFGTAGSFNYWQGWIYSIITFVFLGGTAFYLWKRDPALLERRVKVGVVAEKEKGQKIFQAIGSLATILLVVIPAFSSSDSLKFRIPILKQYSNLYSTKINYVDHGIRMCEKKRVHDTYMQC
jgi:hypothetical protein